MRIRLDRDGVVTPDELGRYIEHSYGMSGAR
jgi:hypothetical protein